LFLLIWIIVVPLSPRAEKQMETKPTKFNDLVGFFFLGNIKLFIKSQSLGVFQGVTKKLKFK
jgi:hypothetical protein